MATHPGFKEYYNIRNKHVKSPEQIKRVAVGYGRAAPRAISWLGGGPCMQARGAYAAMAVHALNGIVGAADNLGGTLKSNKEYTTKFPKPDDFMDDIAKAGKKHKKIDHRGRLEFPSLNKKPGGGVVTTGWITEGASVTFGAGGEGEGVSWTPMENRQHMLHMVRRTTPPEAFWRWKGTTCLPFASSAA